MFLHFAKVGHDAYQLRDAWQEKVINWEQQRREETPLSVYFINEVSHFLILSDI